MLKIGPGTNTPRKSLILLWRRDRDQVRSGIPLVRAKHTFTHSGYFSLRIVGRVGDLRFLDNPE